MRSLSSVKFSQGDIFSQIYWQSLKKVKKKKLYAIVDTYYLCGGMTNGETCAEIPDFQQNVTRGRSIA